MIEIGKRSLFDFHGIKKNTPLKFSFLAQPWRKRSNLRVKNVRSFVRTTIDNHASRGYILPWKGLFRFVSRYLPDRSCCVSSLIDPGAADGAVGALFPPAAQPPEVSLSGKPTRLCPAPTPCSGTPVVDPSCWSCSASAWRNAGVQSTEPVVAAAPHPSSQPEASRALLVLLSQQRNSCEPPLMRLRSLYWLLVPTWHEDVRPVHQERSERRWTHRNLMT